MTKEKNLNKIAKFEKAISEKYGKEAIVNPKSLWDEEKESKYLRDLKDFYSNETKKEKKYLNKGEYTIKCSENSRGQKLTMFCPVCGSYSTSSRDDLYFNKFDCCEKCYIEYVEGREERWKTGWRPNS